MTMMTSKDGAISRMQINDTKAGMGNIDKEKINAIILKSSQNSKFYLKQQKRDNEQRQKAEEKLRTFAKYTSQDLQLAQNKADEFLGHVEAKRDLTKSLVHIDMDAFYASVEMRDDPSLCDKPMAVGSDSMLSTSNYLARRFGVRAAMPGFIARELCPQLVIVPCNFNKYRSDSEKVMRVISEYDSNYSAMSLDEAYLDLTEHLSKRSTLPIEAKTFPKYFVESDASTMDSDERVTFGDDVEECVRELRHRIYLATKLTASAGIASNLRMAKLCSDVNKPNGQFRLESTVSAMIAFVEAMPIRRINGIGPSTALLLDCYGIKTCRDVYEKRAMLYLLETRNTFEFLMLACRGLGQSVIVHDYDKKSLGHETTFSSKLCNNKAELLKICRSLSDEVSKELIGDGLECHKVHMKLKTVDFQVYSRTRTLAEYTNQVDIIFEAAKSILVSEFQATNEKLRLRLVGVRVSDLRSVTEEKIACKLSPESSKTTLSCASTIDRFFTKASHSVKRTRQTDKFSGDDDDDDDNDDDDENNNNNNNNDDENLVSMSDLDCDRFLMCPHCSSTLEGNDAYLVHHLDTCFATISQQ